MVLRGEGPGDEAIQHGAQGGGAWGRGYPAWCSGGRGLGTRLPSMVLRGEGPGDKAIQHGAQSTAVLLASISSLLRCSSTLIYKTVETYCYMVQF